MGGLLYLNNTVDKYVRIPRNNRVASKRWWWWERGRYLFLHYFHSKRKKEKKWLSVFFSLTCRRWYPQRLYTVKWTTLVNEKYAIPSSYTLNRFILIVSILTFSLCWFRFIIIIMASIYIEWEGWCSFLELFLLFFLLWSHIHSKYI